MGKPNSAVVQCPKIDTQYNAIKTKNMNIVSIIHNFLIFTSKQHASTIRSTNKSILINTKNIMMNNIWKGVHLCPYIKYIIRPMIYTGKPNNIGVNFNIFIAIYFEILINLHITKIISQSKTKYSYPGKFLSCLNLCYPYGIPLYFSTLSKINYQNHKWIWISKTIHLKKLWE